MHRKRIALIGLTITLLTPAAAQAKWQQIQGPVLRPTLPWEGKSVQEPTVLWDRGKYRLWYSGGFWEQHIGYAESRDGIHWKKRSEPILRNAEHSSVVKTRRGYMIFSSRQGALTQAFSPDGIKITSRFTIFRPKPGWTQIGFANTFAFRTKKGWRLMYEALGPKPAPGVKARLWRTAITRGGKPGRWTAARGPMQLGHPNGMAGGPWRDGQCVYFHGTYADVLPTKIYRRCGPSLSKLGPIRIVFGRQQPWQHDQVADPSIARAPGKRPLMLFSGVDNRACCEGAAIGAAWLNR